MESPLAVVLRPQSIDDVVGQEHLLGKGRILRNIIETRFIPNMIFYGPSGTGKTTVANIAAKASDKKMYKLNATTASVSDIKSIIAGLDTFGQTNGVLLYLDEIQNFNKKQQQSLLEVIEDGRITLIASTTENPYFYVYNALLSRCSVFEFWPVPPEEIEKALRRGTTALAAEYQKEITVEEDAYVHMANLANGDVRKGLNSLELAVLSKLNTKEASVLITLEDAGQATQKSGLKYDKDGDSHYDILSAFQKSVRGSDPDAAVHYLARLVLAGDLPSICRRLLVMASEDIGLAYPTAVTVVKSCCDAALQLGLPEARIPLAQAVIFLCNAPKSNSALMAVEAALSDIQSMDTGDIPAYLKDGHYSGAKKMGRALHYQYPHDFENHYVVQQYLPDRIKDKKYYVPGENKMEQASKDYWDSIKNAAKGKKRH